MPLGIDPKVDFAFKRMLGSPEHPAVTIHFLNSVLQLADPITSVEILNPIQDKDHFVDKLAVLDVLARDQFGRRLNIEMQATVPDALCERLTYYNCCTYTAQLFEGSAYKVLRPAINICVLDQILFAEASPYHLSFRLRCDQANIIFSDALEFHTLELPKFTAPINNIESLSPVDQWTFLLKYAPELEADELTKLFVDPPLREAVGVLTMIAHSPEERRQYEERLKAQRDEQWRREAALTEGERKGLKEGERKGRKEGVVEGIEKGQVIGQIKLLQQMLGESATSDDELFAKSMQELSALLAEVKLRFESRS